MRSLAVNDRRPTDPDDMPLVNGSRVAVIGGGPAGSLFAFFAMDMAARSGLDLAVDIYEPRDFSTTGPAGCNMCGGIISESLVQALACDGVSLPSGVVQRCIESYMLHVPEGSVRIDPRVAEKRIAALHRGGGPRGILGTSWRSFDAHLLGLAQSKGARLVRSRVTGVDLQDQRPRVTTSETPPQSYDLLAVAVGINSPALKLFEGATEGYQAPRTTKAAVCEIPMGRQGVAQSLGSSMHVFLLDLPRVEFAALIPKGDCVTACLIGEDVDRTTMRTFLQSAPVRACFPLGVDPSETCCHCGPRLNVGTAVRPYGNRIVYVGDCGVTRLYKDGIGAAYRTAKAAATTAVFRGVSKAAFGGQFIRVCQAIERDNRAGRALFACARSFQKRPRLRRLLLDVVATEQRTLARGSAFSEALWDVFTGSAPYREVVLRLLSPRTVVQLARCLDSLVAPRGAAPAGAQHRPRSSGDSADLGMQLGDGEVIVREGETGEHMYVVLQGEVEVYREVGGEDMRLAVLGAGAIFGEMALCDPDVRSASVRALGAVRVLTVDRATFLRRVHEDPSLALRAVEQLCRRIRSMDDELSDLRAQRRDRLEPTERAPV